MSDAAAVGFTLIIDLNKRNLQEHRSTNPESDKWCASIEILHAAVQVFAERVRSYYKRIAVSAGFKVILRYRQGENKTGAGGADVKGDTVTGADRFLHQAAAGGKHRI